MLSSQPRSAPLPQPTAIFSRSQPADGKSNGDHKTDYQCCNFPNNARSHTHKVMLCKLVPTVEPLALLHTHLDSLIGLTRFGSTRQSPVTLPRLDGFIGRGEGFHCVILELLESSTCPSGLKEQLVWRGHTNSLVAELGGFEYRVNRYSLSDRVPFVVYRQPQIESRRRRVDIYFVFVILAVGDDSRYFRRFWRHREVPDGSGNGGCRRASVAYFRAGCLHFWRHGLPDLPELSV
ncbi:hypothetical protein BJ875DRAFT_450189 [Amylocarpus encephaloides]|uniref:Uncharacterized protein n=1 Tax=Amylocarpus encephaloides TaxID=45428 RepID=A0A9P7YSQ8_9HELO|nr:hypothetical protein BJ875DRAFT_450189 [Amylocarpus encephaloides]